MRVLVAAVLLVLLAGCVETRDATGTEAPANGDDGAGPAPEGPEGVDLAVTASAPYTFAPKALSAPTGALVNLTLTNTDPLLPHDWAFDEAGAKTDVIGNGETTSVTFTAPTPGTYEFYCAVGNHRQLGMVGTFTVTE